MREGGRERERGRVAAVEWVAVGLRLLLENINTVA